MIYSTSGPEFNIPVGGLGDSSTNADIPGKLDVEPVVRYLRTESVWILAVWILDTNNENEEYRYINW
jgi:hypothetical protein